MISTDDGVGLSRYAGDRRIEFGSGTAVDSRSFSRLFSGKSSPIHSTVKAVPQAKATLLADQERRGGKSEGVPYPMGAADGQMTADSGGLVFEQIIAHHNALLDGFDAGDRAISVVPDSAIRFVPAT
jgi:hypothetical protein